MIKLSNIPLFSLMVLFFSPSVFSENRVALVIGNSQYEVSELQNPVNDARDVSKVLREKLGFEVQFVSNLKRKEMFKEIKKFRQRINPEDIALFYFSGHGIEQEGKNFLIPVNNRQINDQEDIPIESINANDVLRQMEAGGSRLNIMILDACRDNPLPAKTKSITRGLERMTAAPGSIIAYSTAPGRVANDRFVDEVGDDSHSPYAWSLLQNLTKPGYTVNELFNRVAMDVVNVTKGQQIPWTSAAPLPEIYLSGEKEPVLLEEEQYWEYTQNCDSEACYQAYIRKFPSGAYLQLAGKRLKERQGVMVRIDTLPSSAQVDLSSVDCSDLGCVSVIEAFSPSKHYKPGHYSLVVKQKGYETYERRISVHKKMPIVKVKLISKEESRAQEQASKIEQAKKQALNEGRKNKGREVIRTLFRTEDEFPEIAFITTLRKVEKKMFGDDEIVEENVLELNEVCKYLGFEKVYSGTRGSRKWVSASQAKGVAAKYGHSNALGYKIHNGELQLIEYRDDVVRVGVLQRVTCSRARTDSYADRIYTASKHKDELEKARMSFENWNEQN